MWAAKPQRPGIVLPARTVKRLGLQRIADRCHADTQTSPGRKHLIDQDEPPVRRESQATDVIPPEP